jgi:hypothetical protein
LLATGVEIGLEIAQRGRDSLPVASIKTVLPSRREVTIPPRRRTVSLSVEIRINTRVETVEARGLSFVVHTADGESIRAAGLVAASGSFIWVDGTTECVDVVLLATDTTKDRPSQILGRPTPYSNP